MPLIISYKVDKLNKRRIQSGGKKTFLENLLEICKIKYARLYFLSAENMPTTIMSKLIPYFIKSNFKPLSLQN